jgi:ABC-type multidrug transport system ATPase subunit
MLYAQLTVHENLELACSLYRRAVSAIDEIMSRWGIHQYRHHLPKQLSQGLQARVSLARACMIDPEVLLLDEPSAALDQHSVEILLNEIKRLADRHSGNNLVVIATHDIERLAPFSNRILVIENGSIIRDTRSRDSADIDEAIRAYRRLNR